MMTYYVLIGGVTFLLLLCCHSVKIGELWEVSARPYGFDYIHLIYIYIYI